MLAVQFTRFGAPEVLGVGSAADPHAGEGEVRIRVRAAGVSPVDLSLRDGSSALAKSLVLPHIPGIDAAGVVDQIGPGVQGVELGDEVLGSVDLAKLGGATAEFAVLRSWGRKPAAMAWASAGAAASSIETATRALDLLEPLDGRTLLVDGAAGGVGSVAVQLGIARGAHVVGTARPAALQFVAGLGAEPVVLGSEVSGRRVDRALHIAGQNRLPGLVALTGDENSVVTITDFTAPAIGVRISVGELGGQPHGRHGFSVAAELFESGSFTVPVREVFSVDRAAEAHVLAATSPRWGKVAILI